MKYITIILLTIFPLTAVSQEGIIFKKIELFEAGYESPKEDVVYSTDFSKEKSRYIWTRVFVKNLLYKQSDQTHIILYKYYNSTDSLIAEFTSKFNIKKEMEEVYTSRGWGYEEPGWWEEGIYSVEVYIDDIFVSDKQFIIIEQKYLQQGPRTIEFEKMKFWESPYTPLPSNERVYLKKFPQSEARFIYTTVEVKNLMFGKSENHVNLYLKYYTPDGYIWGVPKISGILNNEWEYAELYNGYGFDDAGNFLPGIYKVEVYYQGKLLGYDNFIIVED
ncbi:MAG: hypothetical protein N2490_07550 [Ignavibacteria bacterium]|nr:hypothetical protein [Ignavibacteria bacterium]